MKKFHYGWVIVAMTFLTLFISSGIRTAISVLFKPFEAQFDWSRTDVSIAAMISLVGFGLGAPLGGSLIDRLGPKRIMLLGLSMNAIGLFLLQYINQLWQFHILWGFVIGIGTGLMTNVLGATVALRWFNQHRGKVLGIFGAASAAVQTVFFPTLIQIEAAFNWQTVLLTLAVIASVALLPIFLFMRNQPKDIGLEPYGEATVATTQTDNRRTSLREALRSRDFWLLAGSFFICGFTTNGLIETHLLPHALDHGFVQAEMSSTFALMGVMNILGSLASGWLTERFDNRRLLMLYYGFRAVSLMLLPFILEIQWMFLFAIVYGWDWVATVPPTVNLTAQRFGRASLGMLYGWIFCSHMIGAALASYSGGFFKDMLGNYHLIFISGAVMGIIAAGLALSISSPRKLATLAATGD